MKKDKCFNFSRGFVTRFMEKRKTQQSGGTVDEKFVKGCDDDRVTHKRSFFHVPSSLKYNFATYKRVDTMCSRQQVACISI